jgi:hypothetical protein
MASSQYQTKDNILPISNADFFRHKHCPMRTVNTRCRNLSNCERVHFGDQAAPEKAIQLRNQILQQVKSFKNELSMSDSHLWTDIEAKVVTLMKWVLCQKHMLHCSAAVGMTIRFLKEEIGISLPEQSAQPHSTVPATTNINAAPSQSVSSVPSSVYASHLATPPLSPDTRARETVYQHCFASQPPNDGAAFDPSFKPPPQSPFVLHMNMPVKAEPATEISDTHAHQTSRSTTSQGTVNNGTTFNNTVGKKERAPYGFGVREPSKTRLHPDNKSAKQPQAKPTDAQILPNGPTVRPHPALKASNQQQGKPKPPFGLTVRERSTDRAPVAQPCLPEASSFSTSARDKHRDSLDVTEQNLPVQSPRSEMDELVERLKAAELRNEELVDKIERLEDNNGRLLVANKQLLEAKKHYKDLYQDAKDRSGELEGENDGLEDELDEAREHIVKLLEELAVLRRPVRGRSVRRRGGQ